MDLYEALKEGKSVQELTKLFQSELKLAQHRIQEDKRQEEEEYEKSCYLAERRQDLINACLNYIEAICDDEFDEESEELMQRLLKEGMILAEKELAKNTDSIENLFTSPLFFAKDSRNASNAILREFLDTLR